MKKIVSLLVLTVILAISSSAYAHTLWVNLYRSTAHGVGHAMMSLGFGHALPMDDMLAGDYGNVSIEKYEFIGPDGKTFPIELPDTTRQKQFSTPWNTKIEGGDLGLRKMAFSKDSLKGVYTLHAQSKSAYFTQYIDNKGRQRLKMLPIDKIKNLQKVVFSTNYNAFARGYLNFGSEWKKPEFRGDNLEIIPEQDPGKIRVGEKATFHTKFMGKDLSAGGTSIEYMTAFSNSFGAKTGLYSMIMGGKSEFRFPEPGQWLLNVFVKKDVASVPELAHLKGKTTVVYYAGTVTVNVLP